MAVTPQFFCDLKAEQEDLYKPSRMFMCAESVSDSSIPDHNSWSSRTTDASRTTFGHRSCEASRGKSQNKMRPAVLLFTCMLAGFAGMRLSSRNFNDGTQHEDELRALDEGRLRDSDIEKNIVEGHGLGLFLVRAAAQLVAELNNQISCAELQARPAAGTSTDSSSEHSQN